MLAVNPFTTLQVVLEPTAAPAGALAPGFLNALLAACLESPTYLDKFYALMPGRPNGAKRLVVLLPLEAREATDPDAVAEAGAFASVVWRAAGPAAEPDDLEPHEYVWGATGEPAAVRD